MGSALTRPSNAVIHDSHDRSSSVINTASSQRSRWTAYWSEHARPWLGRRLRHRVDRLTERLGGPARRRVIFLLGLVLGLNSADNSAIGAIAAQLEPGLHIGTAEQMTTWQVVRYVLRVRTNLIIIIASSLGYFFLAGLRTFAVLFARGHFGVGQGLATLLLAVVGAGAAIGLLTSGRTADKLIRRGHVDARIVVAGASYLAAAALVLPALLSASLLISLPLLVLGAAAISAPNPPLDAAQLDVVPAQLWGRAQGVRTALRNALEAFGPLLFGVLAGYFVADRARLGSSMDQSTISAQAHGLLVTFLLMLIPLAAAGVLLLVTRRHYAVDVASAAESERLGEDHVAGAAQDRGPGGGPRRNS